jgi:sugar phosphate isomerase/epimerase
MLDPKPCPSTRVKPGKQTRREFVHRSLFAASLLAIAPRLLSTEVPRRKLFTGIGITAALDRAAEMKGCGADYLVESVTRFLMPDKTDAEFDKSRERAAAAPLPVLGCNGFLRDPKLRCTGPDADHPRVLAYCAVAFRRLQQVGGEYIVFGSNTARQIPEGWPKEKADEQFAALLREMGPLAARHKIVVGVEQQRASECNYLNRINEVVKVVAAANQPSIRVLADLYHMAVMGDTPADLAKAMPWVSVVELAEKEKRTLPGVAGDDFRPYFTALAQGGYSGRVDIEASGTPEQLQLAFQTISRQAEEASRR